jgi:hypothetical protein
MGGGWGVSREEARSGPPPQRMRCEGGWKKADLFGIFLGGAAEGFLGFADAFLDFAFDLLSGVAAGGAGDVVGLSFDLFDFACGNVFAGHNDLLM